MVLCNFVVTKFYDAKVHRMTFLGQLGFMPFDVVAKNVALCLPVPLGESPTDKSSTRKSIPS